MPSPWPLAVVLGVALVLIALLIAGPWVFPGTRPLKRAFWCPFRHRAVRAGFRESAWDGSLVDVEACSAFTPPSEVTCDKACLGLRHLSGTRR